MARLDEPLGSAARSFVLLRLTKMNGVDLNQFPFEYDLTWMAFFQDAGGRTYARYGGRDADSAEGRLSVKGLRHTMDQVLATHKAAPKAPPPKRPRARTPEDIPTMPALLKAHKDGCVHCHMVYDADYEHRRARGTFKKDLLWGYPLPENVGLRLQRDRPNEVAAVTPGSPAAKAGLRAGDVLRRANGTPVYTAADLQAVLDPVASPGKLTLDAERKGKKHTFTLALPAGWRWRDVSWRKSVRELPPRVGFYGGPLGAAEKKRLGVAADGVAYRLQYVHPPSPAGKAGLRAGDILVAVGGKRQLPYRQLRSYFPLTYAPGDKVEVTYLRGGKEQTTTVRLE